MITGRKRDKVKHALLLQLRIG